MPRSRVTIVGIPQMEAALRTRAALLKAAAAAAVRMEVKAIESDARSEAPRGHTGELVSMIDSQASSASGEVRSMARHAAFQEFGTSRNAAQPYMRPAADRARRRFAARVATIVRKAVD